MRKALVLLSTLLFFIPAVAQAGHMFCPGSGSLTLGATLVGNQFGTSGASPTGFGTAFLTIDPETGEARLRSNVGGIAWETATATIVRNDGTIVGTFTDIEHPFRNGSLENSVILTPELLDDILLNPTNYTVVVSTPTFPGGAIRGRFLSNTLLGGTLAGSTVVGAPGVVNGGGSFVLRIVPSLDAGAGNVMLEYDFVGTGIGNSITGLELRDPELGIAGEPLLTLANSATLIDGRLSGAVPISSELGAAILENPSAFALQANTNAFPSGAVGGMLGLRANEIFLPVVASAHTGLNRWDTDLRLFNTSYEDAATAMIEFFQTGWTSSKPAEALVITIPPRGMRTFDNAMTTMFDLADGMGALRITSNVPLVVTGRIFDDQRGAGRGTFGQTISGLTMCDALSRGIVTGLTAVRSGASDRFQLRTNVGFFNPTAQTVTVNFELRSDAGALIGTRTITLAPFAQTQLSLTGSTGLFNEMLTDLQNGTISYEASAPIFLYASVVDNTSGDANFILPSEDFAVRP